MAVESENVRTVMEWLAQDGPVRSDGGPAAGALAEKLAAVVFQGDAQWPDRPDQADGYRDALSVWLAVDSGLEQQFAALTTPDADPRMFVDWFLTVVTGWESLDSPQQSAAAEDGGDAAGAEPGRYSEPARDDGYGLTYRYDHQAGVYEWYDEVGQTWQDQTWADQYAAGGSGATGYASADAYPTADSPSAAPLAAVAPAASAATAPAPAWDENWKMFYRVDADGMYQFADAVIPGDKSSGWDETWLSHEQVVERTTAPQQQPEATGPHAAAADALHNAMLAAVGSALESDPALKDVLTDDHIKAVLADVAREVIG